MSVSEADGVRFAPIMPMNEPMLAPNLEANPDARNVEAVRLFDRRCIRAALDLYRVDDTTLAIEETDAISDQTRVSV